MADLAVAGITVLLLLLLAQGVERIVESLKSRWGYAKKLKHEMEEKAGRTAHIRKIIDSLVGSKVVLPNSTSQDKNTYQDVKDAILGREGQGGLLAEIEDLEEKREEAERARKLGLWILSLIVSLTLVGVLLLFLPELRLIGALASMIVPDVPQLHWVAEWLFSGLLISGGAKPLHDVIDRIEEAGKEGNESGGGH